MSTDRPLDCFSPHRCQYMQFSWAPHSYLSEVAYSLFDDRGDGDKAQQH